MTSLLSLEFLVFFLLFLPLYWLFWQKVQVQNALLISASIALLYLMAGAWALMALGWVCGLTYIGLWSLARFDGWARTLSLWLIIILIVAHLAFYKYAGAVLGTNAWFENFFANLVLPLGISYYSFMAIARLVDAYHHKADSQSLLGQLSFFATISAGPITRPHYAKGLYDPFGHAVNFSRQWHNTRTRPYPVVGALLLASALIKKWWLAGYLGENWVNPVFANPMGYHATEVFFAMVGYTLQLFFDFSGYSDLAVALGLFLGFRLPMNFNAPLLARNLRVFWERWHITLSTFIRDYIYIPLGGSRHGFWRTQIAVLVAMVLSGIWHGNTTSFLLWGLIHGIGMVMLNIATRLGLRLPTGIAVPSTFLFISIAFVFFRTPSATDAWQFLQALGNSGASTQNAPAALLLWTLIWLLYARFHHTWTHYLKRPKFGYLVAFILIVIATVCAPAGIPAFIYANF